MNLLQATGEERRGMTPVWLERQPSLGEFSSVPDEPNRWRDRPVWNLPVSYAGAASVLMEKMISLASERRAQPPDRLYLQTSLIIGSAGRIACRICGSAFSHWPRLFGQVGRSCGNSPV